MKRKYFKISFLLVILLSIVFTLSFFGCSNKEYTFTYESEGNGYIECAIDKDSTVKSGTKISINAFAIQEDSLLSWNVNGKDYGTKDVLKIKIKQDTIVIAKFSGVSYKNQTFDKFSDNNVTTEQTNCVRVLASSENGYLVTDGTTCRLLSVEEPYKYTTGDVLVHHWTYAGDNEFTIALYKVDKVKIKSNLIKPTEIFFQTNKLIGDYVEITGKLTHSDNFYEIKIANSNYKLLVHEPDNRQVDLSLYNRKYVTVRCYLYGWFDDNYIHAYITECQEAHDVEDNNQGNTGDNTNNDTNKICAYFENDWNDVKIVVNGSQSYNMKKENGYYSYDYSSSIKTVQFKSGYMSTEVFTIDTDKLTFVCTEKRFNNLYSGYFTSSKDLNNSVTKVTTLTMNDLHGYITQTGVDKGGISNTSYLINQIRNENNLDDVLLAANGDMFQGTAVSNLTYGRSVIEAMNLMEFDFMGIGNHEFDWGIEKVFAYFDGDESNGEANFPLINSNIANSKDGTIVLYDGYNIYETYSFKKNGLSIGVVSCIAQLKSSILYTRVCDYDFKDVSEVAIPLATMLKQIGADIVIVNIHGGESSGVADYSDNKALVNAKYNGNPLIDLVINGHTHTNQTGYIQRSGADLAILQASSYNYYLGEYEIYYDTVENRVTSIAVNTYNINSTASSNYDEEVQKCVDENYNKVKNQIDEVYCVAGATISSKSDLYTWGGNVIKASVGAQVGISNNGGIRSTGNITKGSNICLENMYLINPFDNEIVLCKLPAKTLYSYLSRNSSVYYSMDSDLDLSKMANSNEMIDVAVIDYVFYGGYFPNNCEYVNTGIVFRDAMIEDLRLRESFNPKQESEALIANLYKK